MSKSGPNPLSPYCYDTREVPVETTESMTMKVLESTESGTDYDKEQSAAIKKNAKDIKSANEKIQDLENYDKDVYKKEEVDDLLAQKADKSQVPTPDDFYNKQEIDEKLGNYATQEWVGEQGFLTEHQSLDGYATEEWVNEQGFITEHQSLSGLAASVSYDKTAKTIYFYDKNGTVLNTNIDTTDFVKDGMISTVEIVNGNLVITFNTDAGKENITIPLTNIFDPSNYYTKTDIDTKLSDYAQTTAVTDAIATATAGLASEGYVDAAITAVTDDLASEAYVNAAVTAATQDMATKTWVGEQGYLTEHQDISGKLDTTVFDTYTGATATVLDGKADVSDIPDVSGFVTSGDVETQITSKGYITDAALEGYATESSVAASITTATDDMATQTWVQNQGYLTQHQDISGKLDITDFDTYTGATETALEGKADVSDIPDVSGFVTSGDVEAQITSKGYITDAALAGYATESGVAAEIETATAGLATESGVTAAITDATNDMATQTWVGQQGYLTQHQSLEGLAASVSYDANAKTIYFYDKDGVTLDTNIDTTSFVKDGMVNNVEVVEGNLVITFNTDSGKENIIIPLTEIFNPESYYTKEEVDTKLIAKEKEIYDLKKSIGDLGGAVTYDVPNEANISLNSLVSSYNGTVKLGDDIETSRVGPGMFAKNTVKLNLNTHNFTCTNAGNYGAILSRGTQNITIYGKGVIDAANGICIQADGVDSVINLTGSTTEYHNNRSGGELIYCYAGTINITNGIFKNDGENKGMMLNCYDSNYQAGKANIVVTGGKFYGFNPADNNAEGEHTSFVPEGYTVVESVEEGITVYTVKKA